MSRSALNFALKRQLAAGTLPSADPFAVTDAWQPDDDKLKASAYEFHGNTRTFNMETVLAQNIVGSNYFKWDLLEWPNAADLLGEARAKVTHLEPWAPGGAHNPSPAFCLLYRLALTRLTSKELTSGLLRADAPLLRGLGLLYLRYTCPPDALWEWFTEALEEGGDIALSPGINAASSATTLAAFARRLLAEPRYSGTQLPPVPVKVRQDWAVKLLLLERDAERAKSNALAATTTPALLAKGARARARYSGDDKWYDATIDGADESSAVFPLSATQAAPVATGGRRDAAAPPDLPIVRRRYWVTYDGFDESECIALGRIMLQPEVSGRSANVAHADVANTSETARRNGGDRDHSRGRDTDAQDRSFDGRRAEPGRRGDGDDTRRRSPPRGHADLARYGSSDTRHREPLRGYRGREAHAAVVDGGGDVDDDRGRRSPVRRGRDEASYRHEDGDRRGRSRSRSRSSSRGRGRRGRSRSPPSPRRERSRHDSRSARGDAGGLWDGGDAAARPAASDTRRRSPSPDYRSRHWDDRHNGADSDVRGGGWRSSSRRVDDDRTVSRAAPAVPRGLAEDDDVDALRRRVQAAARAGALASDGSYGARPAGVNAAMSSRVGGSAGVITFGDSRASGYAGGRGDRDRSLQRSRSRSPDGGSATHSADFTGDAPTARADVRPPPPVPPPAPSAAALARMAELQSRYGDEGSVNSHRHVIVGAARDGDEDIVHVQSSWAGSR